MKRRCPGTSKIREKDSLGLISPAGMNSSSRMSSRGPSDNADLNIPVKFKSMPSHTSYKAMTFSAKLNPVWARQQSLLFLS